MNSKGCREPCHGSLLGFWGKFAKIEKNEGFTAYTVPGARDESRAGRPRQLCWRRVKFFGSCARGKKYDKCHLFLDKTRRGAVYINMTEPAIICRQSAFKHGVTEEDIRWAFKTVKYDSPLEGDEDIANVVERRLLIGFNISANPLEVMYYELDDGTACVFHAMPCRNINIPLLNQ